MRVAVWISLREKCPYLEFFRFLFSAFRPNARQYRPEKLRIRTFFTFLLLLKRIKSKLVLSIQLQSMADCAEDASQPAFTCSELTIKTLEQDAKYVQS